MGMKEMQREQGNPRVKGKGPENLRSRLDLLLSHALNRWF